MYSKQCCTQSEHIVTPTRDNYYMSASEVVSMFCHFQSGNLKVVNHTTGEKAAVKFHAYSYFSRERQRKVCEIIVLW